MDRPLATKGRAKIPRFMQEEILSEFKRKFSDGNKLALPAVIWWCFYYGCPVPRWATEAYCGACLDISRFKAASWDDVLGRAHPKGRKLGARRKRSAIAAPLFLEGRRLEKEMPVDDRLFEKLGKQFKVSPAAAKRIFYDLDLNDTANPIRLAIKTVEEALGPKGNWKRRAFSQKTQK
jgi:hypothetical protein